uniref:EF-hand domain-containing protein n=1 Tax=Macrostomum lignano TaxID=282301 RepID=A0A1I8FK31_9PLAT
ALKQVDSKRAAMAQSSADGELRAMLAAKAGELFALCDTEAKGFIVHSDMRRLCDLLPLTADEVDGVFDKLDGDGNGQLTLDEFTSGFVQQSMLRLSLRLHSPRRRICRHLGRLVRVRRRSRRRIAPAATLPRRANCDEYCLDEDEHFQKTVNKLIESGIFQEKMTAHEEEMRRLYEEMEASIAHSTANPQLEKRLSAVLNQAALGVSSGERAPRKERDSLEVELAESREALDESRSYIDELQRKLKEDRRRRAVSAMRLTEGIALERESLVRQIEDLREANAPPEGPKRHRRWRRRSGRATRGEASTGKELLQSLLASAAVRRDPRRYHGGSDDGCEFDDMSGARLPPLDDRKAEVEEELICASVAALAASEAVRSRCLSPPPVKETAEIATMEVRESPEGAGDDEEFLGPESLSEGCLLCVNRTPERVFKVVFIGDSGVGKSSVIHRLCQDAFKSTFAATIGIDFQVKAMELEGQVIALQLWDTAGQERFRSITKQYFRKADGIVIVYDVTSAPKATCTCASGSTASRRATATARVDLLAPTKKAATEVAGSARAVEAQAAQRLADECSDSGKAAPALFLKSAPRAASPLAKPSSSLP